VSTWFISASLFRKVWFFSRRPKGRIYVYIHTHNALAGSGSKNSDATRGKGKISRKYERREEVRNVTRMQKQVYS